MIVVKLMGGLGNQMFQYALGRSLALKHKTDLVFDESFLKKNERHTYRKFSLDKFQITAEVSNKQYKFENQDNHFFNPLKSIFNFEKKLVLIKETDFSFDKDVLNSPDHCYLDGYWQSFKYFENSSAQLRKDFQFSFSNPPQVNVMVEKIRTVNSVSIHIRRGDYVKQKETNLYHGVCDITYYKKAVNNMVEQLLDPVFFIFSDDPIWAKENMRMENEHYFVSDSVDPSAHVDLMLLSSCKHAIIANSSFSWWGAWLITNPDKKVIAPSKWFADSSINTSDLIPFLWQRI